MAQETTTNPLVWKDKIVTYVIEHSGALIGAIIVFVVGIIAARWIGNIVDRWLSHKALEPPVRMLVTRVVRLLVMVFALVIALGTLGMNIGAVIAVFGVVGVGIGLAVQGVLGNLVAGLSIIFTKPFRVGEYIELAGVHGQVTTIELFSTTLVHPDRSRVVVPNRKIVGEILHNYGGVRQLDLTVGVAYATNVSEALAVVRDILSANPRVLKEPAPVVGVTTLADSSINIAVKPWTAVADFGPAQAEIYQAIVEQFRAKRIEIPFPQREVRLLDGAEGKS